MNTILKLSSLYDDESWSIPGALTIDLRSLEGCCCYCDPEAEESIKAAMSGAQTAGVHWIDTGDYHYITKFWLERGVDGFRLDAVKFFKDRNTDPVEFLGWFAEGQKIKD